MDFDISKILDFLGDAFTNSLNCFLSVSRAINDHSATVTIVISVFGAIFAWLLYRHRTKRRLKVNVSLNRDAFKLLKKGEEVKSEIWNVLLINPRYHKVYVKEVGLLYRDMCCGKNKKFPISRKKMEIDPGSAESVPLRFIPNSKPCPLEISGAYAIDETGKEWRIRKKLKAEE